LVAHCPQGDYNLPLNVCVLSRSELYSPHVSHEEKMKLVDLPERPIQCMNLVGREWSTPQGSSSLPVISPYTGKQIGTVPLSGPEAVSDAIQRSVSAFPAWRNTPIKERCQHLFRFRELALLNIDKLANTAAMESGKTVAEAKAGILKGLEVVEFALSLQNMSHGGILEVSRGVTCHSVREPLGVVVGITPFNFPAMVPLWMYPIALALGNCFILKPSEKVPLTSQLVGDLLRTAGIPPGVFSVVNGDRATVEALITHPEVRAVGFVGSTAAAQSVYATATSQGKRALCLGGAKNSVILVPDADEAIATSGVVASFTGCAGQRCMAASLLLAVGPVDHLIAKIAESAEALKPGDCLGAIIDRAAYERICNAIDIAAQDGAKILVDGRSAKAPVGYEGGIWLGPTIIDRANIDMECAQLEIFGPVLTIVRVNSLSEALAIEARSQYGNATSVFTTSGAVARQVAARASAGMVGINIGVPVPREPFSFGGTKQSKFGSGDITGMSAVEFWSALKKVTTKWEETQGDVGSPENWMS